MKPKEENRRLAELDLFNGEAIEAVPVRWQSKRLANDLALEQTGAGEHAVPVSRANRLGRAVAGAGSRSAV
jgi:hypothetical protein